MISLGREPCMNELLLIEMFGEVNPELLNNNIIEKDLKRGKPSIFKKIFIRNKWNDEDDFTLNTSYYDKSMLEQTPLSMDSTDSIKSEDIEYDYKNNPNDSETEDENALFNISIFKKSFKNLIKIISGLVFALLVLVGIIIFIVKLILKNHKYCSFIRRKIQVSY